MGSCLENHTVKLYYYIHIKLKICINAVVIALETIHWHCTITMDILYKRRRLLSQGFAQRSCLNEGEHGWEEG